MPWTPEDAERHTKLAKSPTAKRQWRDVANGVLKETGDEGRAIREANSVINRRMGGVGVGGTPGRNHGNRQFNAEDSDGDGDD